MKRTLVCISFALLTLSAFAQINHETDVGLAKILVFLMILGIVGPTSGHVILHWLTQYNKQEVQYRAGHKYISSTEQYVQQEMGSLTDQLAKYHPFG